MHGAIFNEPLHDATAQPHATQTEPGADAEVRMGSNIINWTVKAFINPSAWAVLAENAEPAGARKADDFTPVDKVCEIPDGPGAHERARLISTAPDGLELARLVMDYFDGDEIPDQMDCDRRLLDKAKAIIAQAEGVYESGASSTSRT